MIQLGKADKAAILKSLGEASAGAERLRQGPPAVTVRLHQLRDPTAPPRELARGTFVPAASYDEVRSAPMYALTDAARVDVLRFGRHPDQDLQILDRLVSREHGLVIFSDRLPLFCDYGTLIDGAHAGSTNGTWIDGERRIRDAMIPWLPGQELMFGSTYTHGSRRAFAFKLTYELHPTQPIN